MLYFTFFEKGFPVVYEIKNATEKMTRKVALEVTFYFEIIRISGGENAMT